MVKLISQYKIHISIVTLLSVLGFIIGITMTYSNYLHAIASNSEHIAINTKTIEECKDKVDGIPEKLDALKEDMIEVKQGVNEIRKHLYK